MMKEMPLMSPLNEQFPSLASHHNCLSTSPRLSNFICQGGAQASEFKVL